MGALIAIAAVVLLMGGTRSSTPAPPPQQTPPPQPQGQQTGQVVADVAVAAIDLFRAFMNGASATTAK